jgi:atypical dual specificity phosphatase
MFCNRAITHYPDIPTLKKELSAAGVRKMEAGDIMRKVYGYVFGHPMNVSEIDDKVYGSAAPMSKKEIAWFAKEKGVKAILSLTKDGLPREWLGQLAEYKHIPIKNHSAPTISQLNESVSFLVHNAQEGRISVVHCAAGKGRTGTVLAAYLCASKHVSAEEAVRAVRAKRAGSVEKNTGQEEAVLQFRRFLSEPKETQ